MFWKKSPEKKLKKQYDTLMEEAYRLSSTDRKKSDAKYAEAEEVMKEMEQLKKEG